MTRGETVLITVLLATALLLAEVSGRKGFGPGDQEWGHSEVRKGAHMFWWLYYTTAENVARPQDRPLVIWLQGGPGASGTGFGNFKEFGPLDEDLKPRNYTWVKDCNVMFIDNPVGTGFSYVQKSSLLTRNNQEIASDLVEMMRDFYKRLPEFQDTPLYITSESYGGKMAAEFALLLDAEIKKGTIEANLRGVGLGDSWISPVDSVLTWAPYLLSLGAVDADGFRQIDEAAQATRKAVEAGRFADATNLWSRTEGVVLRVTDGVDFYDVMKRVQYGGKTANATNPRILPGVAAADAAGGLQLRDSDKDIYAMMNGDVKKALALPAAAVWRESSGEVFTALSGDFMKPVTAVVEELLNSTDVKVAVFSGQKDLIVDTPGTYAWVQRLRWKGRAEWDRAPRRPLVNDNFVEGYSKEAGNMAMYWVNRAGHMVPLDNPAAMDVILSRLTKDYEGGNEPSLLRSD